MAISTAISRLTAYYARHGFGPTIRRLGLQARRALLSSRMVLFYCDLASQTSPPVNVPSSVRVERYENQSSLSPRDLKEITNFWNPRLARHNIEERFELGASIWLIKVEDNLAGYGWTLQGRTVEPHYFPLGKDDVQFLDFHVFPKYRGRALGWFLMAHILHRLAVEGRTRAFGEAAEWNKASLASYAMTPFRRLGRARKLTLFRRTIVCWEQEPELKGVSFTEATGRKGFRVPDLRS